MESGEISLWNWEVGLFFIHKGPRVYKRCTFSQINYVHLSQPSWLRVFLRWKENLLLGKEKLVGWHFSIRPDRTLQQHQMKIMKLLKINYKLDEGSEISRWLMFEPFFLQNTSDIFSLYLLFLLFRRLSLFYLSILYFRKYKIRTKYLQSFGYL